MRIIIAGAGEVGLHIARLLANEAQDIALIDCNPEKLRKAANSLDVATVEGKSTSYKVLQEANVSKADLLIAATTEEENNLATAIIAKKLGAKKTIARISNIEFHYDRESLDLKSLGIDEVISPEALAAKEIQRLLKEKGITDNFDFEDGKLSLIGISLGKQDRLIGKSIRETAYLNPNFCFIPVVILRGKQTIIPRGNTVFAENDHIYYITKQTGVQEVLELTGNREKKEKQIKNIMILGGSRVAFHTAKRLCGKFNVKLIEKDKEKAFTLADTLPDVLVVNGDARNVSLLEEEGLNEMDVFIAVTGDSEMNIISSLVAKNHKVGKTIALVENMDYVHLSQDIGVDTMINKKLIAANFIFRYVRKGRVVSITSIHGADVEILEFEVEKGSRITRKKLKNMNFPKKAIIGGVIRGGEVYIVMGDFQFQPSDRVVVISKQECVHRIESFFK